MSMNSNVQTLNEMANDATDQLKTLKDVTEILISDGYGVNLDIMQKVKGLTDEDIDDFHDDELDTLLVDNDGQAVDFAAKLIAYNKGLPKDSVFLDMLGYKRHVLKDICKNIRDLDEAANAMGDIINDKNALMKEYVESILTKSPERNKARIEKLKVELEKAETDEGRAKIQKIINVFENLNSLNYIFKDIDLYNQKELDIIVSNFLDPKKADYIVNKFLTKCKQMKINPDFYKMFLNMEELFLDEEYSAFNNLFLFFTMRYIAYGNPYNATDKSYALTMIISMQKLMTGKYKNDEEKEQFLLVVKKFLDYFMPYTEKFKAENATYKYHPIRLEHDKVVEEKLYADNFAKGTLPIQGEGDYIRGERMYNAWYNGVCKDCGGTLRWTSQAEDTEHNVQCMNPNCSHHLFTIVRDEEKPDFYAEETPLMDDHGTEVKFPEETVDAVAEIIPEKLSEIQEAVTESNEVIDVDAVEESKDDNTSDGNEE